MYNREFRKSYENILYIFWGMVRDVRFCMIGLSRLEIVLKLFRCMFKVNSLF